VRHNLTNALEKFPSARWSPHAYGKPPNFDDDEEVCMKQIATAHAGRGPTEQAAHGDAQHSSGAASVHPRAGSLSPSPPTRTPSSIGTMPGVGTQHRLDSSSMKIRTQKAITDLQYQLAELAGTGRAHAKENDYRQWGWCVPTWECLYCNTTAAVQRIPVQRWPIQEYPPGTVRHIAAPPLPRLVPQDEDSVTKTLRPTSAAG
jgi:hypothetical protein